MQHHLLWLMAFLVAWGFGLPVLVRPSRLMRFVPWTTRSRWAKACRAAHLITPAGRMPQVESVGKYGPRHDMVLRLPSGMAVPQVEAAANEVGARFGAWAATVDTVDLPLGRARIRLLTTPTFAGPPTRSLYRELPAVDVWDKIRIGTDIAGQEVLLRLIGRNLLIGGVPGAGKSIAIQGLTCGLVLDSSVDVWLFDPKILELQRWLPVASRFVGNDTARACELLEEVLAEVGRRTKALAACDLRDVHRGLNLRPTVLIIDEMARYTQHVDKKLAARFTHLLTEIVSLGRAVGVCVVAATQRPSSQVLSTDLRDLFQYRLAFRVTTPESSDMILGSGRAAGGYNAQDIPDRSAGVGLLLEEEKVPRLIRTDMIEDEDLKGVLREAMTRRDAWPQPAENMTFEEFVDDEDGVPGQATVS